LCKVANREANKQTNNDEYITYLAQVTKSKMNARAKTDNEFETGFVGFCVCIDSVLEV